MTGPDSGVARALSRRRWLELGLLGLGAGSLTTLLCPTRLAHAFGDSGAFHPRLLDARGSADVEPVKQALGRWSYELTARTSAPARLAVDVVDPSSAALLSEPLLIWSGEGEAADLSKGAIRRLREFLGLGGTLIVDGRGAGAVAFVLSVKRQLGRILPQAAPVTLPKSHVLFKSFYLLDGPAGLSSASTGVLAYVTGKNHAQVLLLSCDLLGALMPGPGGQGYAFPIHPGGSTQRELAVRFAVNLGMYVLCSDYKDDQVHAPFLMRRRQRSP
jgi:hypothetical protein